MNGKESVSSQDVPTVIRALGTLALAAAMTVAIKWFILRDTKGQKEKDNEAGLQRIQDSVEDRQSHGNGPKEPKEEPGNNSQVPQVSEGVEIKGTFLSDHSLLSKGLLDTSFPSRINDVQEDSNKKEGIRINCDIPDDKTQLGGLTPRNSDAPQCAKSRSAVAEIKMPPSDSVDMKSNDTQEYISSDSDTDRSDVPYFERSQSIQKLDIEIKSGNGECIDHMNVESPGCQQELIGYGSIVSGRCLHHSTVNMGLHGDTFNTGQNDKVRLLNCDSISKSIDKGVQHRIAYAPCVPASEGSIITNTGMPIYSQFTDLVLMKSENNIHLTICPKYPVKKQLEYQVEPSDVKKTNECSKDIPRKKTLHYQLDTKFTYRQQLNMGQEILLVDGKSKDVPKQSVIPDIVTYKESIDTGNRLSNSHNEQYKEITPVTEQIASSQNHTKQVQVPKCIGIQCSKESKSNSTLCHHNNNVLQWSTTTVYNSTEYIDLMYPLTSENSQITENYEHHHYANSNGLFTQNNKISKNVFANLSFERTFQDLDADMRSSDDATYDDPKCLRRAINKPKDFVCHPCTFDTFNKQVVTKGNIISTITSKNNAWDNIEHHSCRKHDAEDQYMRPKECYTFTNGCFTSSHKNPDEKRVCSSSKIYKQKSSCEKNQSQHIYKPLSVFLHNSMLQNQQRTNWKHPYSCTDNSTSVQPIKDTHGPEDKQSAVPLTQEPNIKKPIISVGITKQTCDAVDFLLPTFENTENNNIDKIDLRANTLEEDQHNGLRCHNPIHNLEKDKLPSKNIKMLCPEKADDTSRKHIMSTIAEHPELLLPEYHSVSMPKKKIPLMTKSCENIHFRSSCLEVKLKNKAQSMLCLLTEYYSSKLHSPDNEPVEEVARGSFVCIPKGLQYIDETKRFQLTLGNCLQLLKLARKNSVPELLKAVYTLISDNYLNVLKNSAIYGQLTGLERERILQLRMRGKSSLCVVEMLSIFNLNPTMRCSVESDQVQSKSKLYSLDMETNQWKDITTIPEEACLKGCSICSMHNYLFIAGGIQQTNKGSVCSSKLFCYNPLTDIWTQLTSMTQARSQLKLIPLDGYLYAIGGECLHTMERYDPRSNKWTFAAPLPKGSFAVAHEAVACGGEIYISGGHLFYRLLKYKPTSDQWEECPFNASKGRSCDMVAVGSILYRFDMNKDSTVNIFKYNTNTKMWSEYTTTFPGSKAPFRCAVLNDTIYCLNRETVAQFSVENGKAMFEPAIFSAVPTRAVGFPYPVVLSLRGSMSQTSV